MCEGGGSKLQNGGGGGSKLQNDIYLVSKLLIAEGKGILLDTYFHENLPWDTLNLRYIQWFANGSEYAALYLKLFGLTTRFTAEDDIK